MITRITNPQYVPTPGCYYFLKTRKGSKARRRRSISPSNGLYHCEKPNRGLTKVGEYSDPEYVSNLFPRKLHIYCILQLTPDLVEPYLPQLKSADESIRELYMQIMRKELRI